MDFNQQPNLDTQQNPLPEPNVPIATTPEPLAFNSPPSVSSSTLPNNAYEHSMASPVPTQPSSVSEHQVNSNSVTPIPIVKVLSPRGVEYVFMTLTLFSWAIGLGAAIISMANGQTGFTVLAYPTAVLVVSVPVFAWLFLRLKKAEAYNPNLKLDPSKRRSTQFTQIATFIICFFTLIGLVSAIFAKISGSYSGSLIKLILDALIVLVIAGGILFYYWHDEHR